MRVFNLLGFGFRLAFSKQVFETIAVLVGSRVRLGFPKRAFNLLGLGFR